jgi:SAM-dependent methyltransferase
MDDWYDYPQYYDLAFSDETMAEVNFIVAACKKYAKLPVKRLLEPGCGSGRLVVELAKRGYQMVAFDNSAKSLDYLRKKLERKGLKAELFHGDMTDFALRRPVDAAFNTFNTFRHLTTETTALKHLQCMARAIKPGGLFILGLHLLPPDASLECLERWTARRGKTKVNCTLRVTESSRRTRLEHLHVTMRVRTPAKDFKVRTEFPLRLYTAEQLRSLLAKVPQFQLCDVFDFCYEIDDPLELDDEISDTVLVLRRQA